MNGCHCHHTWGVHSHPFQNNRSICPQNKQGINKCHIQNEQHKLKMVLSIVVYPILLQCHLQRYVSRPRISYIYIGGGEQHNKKTKKKKGVSYMLSRVETTMQMVPTCMQVRVSYQSILKHFPFFYVKSMFTTCAQFQFPSYIQFYKFHWVVVSTLTYTH